MSRTRYALIICVLMLIFTEVALQIRSELRFGNSIFSKFGADEKPSMYQQSALLGVKSLTPNSRFEGSEAIIESNSLGLRMGEINNDTSTKRVIFLGASSVMGAYAKSNQHTSSELLEKKLSDQYGMAVQVVNAGIAGLSVKEQATLLSNLLKYIKADVLILYTGLNDLAGYCQSSAKSDKYSLPQVSLPKWLLSIDLALKNTVSIRHAPAAEVARETKPDFELKTDNYRQALARIKSIADANNLRVIAVHNGKSYRESQSLDTQLSLSETARYYNSCFTLATLYKSYELHNQAIDDVFAGHPILSLEAIVPGGKKYFADASHMTLEGEKRLTDELAPQVATMLKGKN